MSSPADLGLDRATAPDNPQRQGAPTPPDLALTVRDMRFGRGKTPARWWINGDAVATAWFNALSATFPRGEAFFVESVKACRDGAPPRLDTEIRDFIRQEVNHSREHLAFNRAAVDAGYDLSRIDAHVEEMLALTHDRPAVVNLAATMALEHFTALLAHELLSRPAHLAGADDDVADMWRWHAIEEIEHKGVAYDTYLHATRGWSRWNRWRVKAIMMVVVSKHFLHHRWLDTLDLLGQDGMRGWRVKLRVLRYLLVRPGFLRRIFPAWLGYLLPGFHPWRRDDRPLIAAADQGLAQRD